jgi:hypothetical protein
VYRSQGSLIIGYHAHPKTPKPQNPVIIILCMI